MLIKLQSSFFEPSNLYLHKIMDSSYVEKTGHP